jgi:hypothetical protein
MKKTVLLTFFIIFLFAGNCNKKLFTLHLKNPVKFSKILSDISNECNLNIIIKDNKSYKVLNSDINFVNVENVTLKELFNTLFDVKNLFYKIEGNKLYISYYKTKTFKLDFVPNSITGISNVDAEGMRIFVNDENAISSVASVLDQSKDQVKLGAKGPIYLRLINSSLPGEVEIDLGESFPINPQIRGAIKSLNGVVEV